MKRTWKYNAPLGIWRRARRHHKNHRRSRDLGRVFRRPTRIVRIDDRRPHAHVVKIHEMFYVIRFDARGRQGRWLLGYADGDKARKVRDQINRRLRRAR